MTKIEYLELLKKELEQRNISDTDEIVSEYEQHFAFKLADGYSEEEIAAKLGAPATIAAQFTTDEKKQKTGTKGRGKKAFLVIWLTFLGIFEAALDIVFAAFGAGVFGAAIAFGTAGVCLVGRLNIAGLIPNMPYSGALLFGVSLIALAVLFFVLAVYCFALLKQIVKASVRWRKNVLNQSALPLLPVSPQFQPKNRRALRTVLLLSLVVFGVTFVIGYGVLALQAGSPEFWHVYGWFV